MHFRRVDIKKGIYKKRGESDSASAFRGIWSNLFEYERRGNFYISFIPFFSFCIVYLFFSAGDKMYCMRMILNVLHYLVCMCSKS